MSFDQNLPPPVARPTCRAAEITTAILEHSPYLTGRNIHNLALINGETASRLTEHNMDEGIEHRPHRPSRIS
jgi:hypothetical protein